MSDSTEPETPARTRLVLVRHGESVATQQRFIGGPRTCRGLTDLGRLQAAALRDRWAASPEYSVDVLVSSHFPRAIQTAEIFAPAIGHLAIEVVPGVGEHDPGPICDGLSYVEFEERYGKELDWNDPFREYFAGGETMSAFHHRVATALHEVADRHEGKTVVIACHGGVVDVAFRSFLRMPIAGNFELHTLNTSITSFERVRSRKWKLERYNDAAHLVGLPASS
jgi:probable phosphoglycerate mutase